MMLEEFSGGYYIATMDVQPYSDGPVIDRGLYDFINRELYYDSDSPVMMRLGLDSSTLFGVTGEPGVPRDVLAMPEELIDEWGEQNVFVLKSEYTDVVGDYSG